MRAGLCRLLMLRLGSDLRALRKKLPELDRMRLQYAKAPPPPGRDESEGPAEPVDLADELVALILDLAFLEGRPPIRDRRTFNARLEENRPQLAAVAGDACALTGRILTRYQAIRRRLADITQANWIASVKDMSGHLDALVFRGFLQQVPYARLRHTDDPNQAETSMFPVHPLYRVNSPSTTAITEGKAHEVANSIQAYKPVKKSRDYRVKAQSSAGSIENLRKVNAGKIQLGMVFSGHVYLDRQGRLKHDNRKYDKVLAVAYLMDHPSSWWYARVPA